MRNMHKAVDMLKRTAVCVLGGLAIAALIGLTAPEGISAEKSGPYASLFDAVWSITDRNFYDPYFLGHNWKAIGQRFRAKLGAVHSQMAFETLADVMLDRLGASHLYVIPPRSSAASIVGIGVRFRDLNGKYFVSFVDPLSDARARGIRIGDRLLSPKSNLWGAPGSVAKLQMESCDGTVRSLRVRREGTFWPPVHPGFAWHAIQTGTSRAVGYLRITRFDDGAAELIDQAMDELKNTNGLIIDVRDNSGGNLSALRLVSYFSGRARIAVALFSRPYLEKLGHPVTARDVENAPKVVGAYTDAGIFAAIAKNGGGAAFMTQDVGTKEYTKPVVVLVNHHTASAGEGFAWEMKDITQATLVGRTTAGMLLSGKEFNLSGGWKLVVPVDGLWGPHGADFRDRPVRPDIEVHWTRADMCSGRDPDLERALSLLQSRATQ